MAFPNTSHIGSALAGSVMSRDVEYFEDFVGGGTTGKFSTTADGADWLTTNVTGTGVYTIADAELGGVWRIDTGAITDNHGCNCQMNGEAWAINASRDLYFETRLKIAAAASITKCDWVCGLCATDTSVLAGVADGIVFRSGAVDTAPLDANSAAIVATTGDDMAASWTATTISEALTGLSWVLDEFRTLAFLVEGNRRVRFFVDGAEKLNTTTNIPDVGTFLTPTIAIQNGDGVTREVMEVDYFLVAQTR